VLAWHGGLAHLMQTQREEERSWAGFRRDKRQIDSSGTAKRAPDRLALHLTGDQSRTRDLTGKCVELLEASYTLLPKKQENFSGILAKLQGRMASKVDSRKSSPNQGMDSGFRQPSEHLSEGPGAQGFQRLRRWRLLSFAGSSQADAEPYRRLHSSAYRVREESA